MQPVSQIHVGQILKGYWLERLSNYSPPELPLVLVHLFSWTTYLEVKPKLSGPLAVLKDPGLWASETKTDEAWGSWEGKGLD